MYLIFLILFIPVSQLSISCLELGEIGKQQPPIKHVYLFHLLLSLSYRFPVSNRAWLCNALKRLTV